MTNRQTNNIRTIRWCKVAICILVLILVGLTCALVYQIGVNREGASTNKELASKNDTLNMQLNLAKDQYAKVFSAVMNKYEDDIHLAENGSCKTVNPFGEMTWRELESMPDSEKEKIWRSPAFEKYTQCLKNADATYVSRFIDENASQGTTYEGLKETIDLTQFLSP